MKSHSNDTLLKVDQVAKLLNVSVSAVYKWTQAGEFPAPYSWAIRRDRPHVGARSRS